jgi:hypothetical protein
MVGRIPPGIKRPRPVTQLGARSRDRAAGRSVAAGCRYNRRVPRAPVFLALALAALRCTSPADPSDGTTSTTTSATSTSVTDDPGTTADPDGSTTAVPTTGEPPCFDPDVCPPVCDTLLQDCPAGFKCTGVKPSLLAPYAGTACVPDNAGVGAPADDICINADDGSDTCDPQTMCMQFGSGEGACLPFCTGAHDAPTCADPARVCARIDRLWPLWLCVPPCDPLAYACTDADLGVSAMVCAPASVGFGCVLRGHLQGAALGQPCADHRDCTGAAHCAAQADVPGCTGASCCAAYCDLAAPDCPVAGQSCVPYYAQGEAPPGLEDVGLCGVP